MAAKLSDLSFVFMQSALLPSFEEALGKDFPDQMWDNALADSEAKPDQVIRAPMTKQTTLSFGDKTMGHTLSFETKELWPAYIATFKSGTDAVTFYNCLSKGIEKAGSPMAVTIGAVAWENDGKIKKLGYQV